VRSYFGSDPRRMIRGLLRETARIDHRVCPTEIEAQVREIRAIARWRPRFNRRDKPPANPVWLKLTSERFPRLSIVRTIRDDGATYLGPLRSRRDADLIRDALHDALPLRRCTLRIGARTRAPACALAELGRCIAPCTGELSPARYEAVVDQARMAMREGSGPATRWLAERMIELSDAERYHEARWRRDRLSALTDAVQRQRTTQALGAVDLAAWRPTGDAHADVIRVVDGRLAGSARCERQQVTTAAASLPDAASHDDDPYVVAVERMLLTRWLTRSATALLWVDGTYGEPVAGGQPLHATARRLRRRRHRAGSGADELRAKRVRRASTVPA
jgi:DNA polymerase-3 subunit epsilon